MIAVRGRSKASRVGPAAELDQPSSAGPSAALPGCETSMSVVYPVRLRTCNLTRDAALLEDEGSTLKGLSGALPGGRGVRATTGTSCAVACAGAAASLVRLDRKSERYQRF